MDAFTYVILQHLCCQRCEFQHYGNIKSDQPQPDFWTDSPHFRLQLGHLYCVSLVGEFGTVEEMLVYLGNVPQSGGSCVRYLDRLSALFQNHFHLQIFTSPRHHFLDPCYNCHTKWTRNLSRSHFLRGAVTCLLPATCYCHLFRLGHLLKS